MELQQLRYLVAVARTGNFSRAAAQCHVAQPSLSQQIRKLEDELGERIFDRMKSGARLTASGRAVHERAVRILAEVQAARREAMEARALSRGLVTIGVLPTIAPYLLPGLLSAFSRDFPGIQVVVQEDTTAQLLRLLSACELDLAVASLPIPGEALHLESLFTEELRLALPVRHPLAKQPSISLKDLESERFILMKEGHCLGDQILNFCHRRDFHPNVLCRSTQIETILALVKVGMGISLVPAMACQAGPADRLRFRSLTPRPPQRQIVAVWLRERAPGQAAEALLGTLRSRSKAKGTGSPDQRP